MLYEYIGKKYKESHRRFKQSGQHDNFDKFVGNDSILAPTLYYFHLHLLESQYPTQQTQAMNTLPFNHLVQSISDDENEVGVITPSSKKKRKLTHHEQYKMALLNSRINMANTFQSLCDQRKGNTEGSENKELDQLKVEKGLNNQAKYLLKNIKDFTAQLQDADNEEKEILEGLLKANKKSLSRIVKKLSEDDPTTEQLIV